jgi:hypothetical protein
MSKKRPGKARAVTDCKFRSPQNSVCLAYDFERSAKIWIANMLCGRRGGCKLKVMNNEQLEMKNDWLQGGAGRVTIHRDRLFP